MLSRLLMPRSTSPDADQGPRPPKVFDVDPERRRERERQLAIRQAELELAGEGAVKEKVKEDPKAEVSALVQPVPAECCGGDSLAACKTAGVHQHTPLYAY